MWHTWHVVYYQPDKDALLLSSLKPLLQRLSTEGLLERYALRIRWRQGPRVIVDLRPPPGREEELARLFESELGAWVATHPSQCDMPPEQLLAQHRQLAALEQEPEALEPLHPDNSVLRMPYQPPSAGVGPVMERMAQEFSAEATPLLLEMMERSREGKPPRKDFLFQALLSLILLNEHPRYAHFSLRSHCEGFLQRFDARQELRGKLEAYVGEHHGQLLRSVEQAQRYARGEGEDVLLRTWVALCARMRQRLAEQVASGELTMPSEGGASEFHRAVLASSSFQWLSKTPHFLAMRCLLDWHSGLFPLAGLVPVMRVKIGYLVSRAIELSVGATWSEALEQYEG